MINIKNAVISNNGTRITNKLDISSDLKTYFRSNEFYAEYDRNISDVPMGILNIPALSSVIHFAWAIGCNISIGEIDKTYLKGLEKIRLFLKGHIGFRAFKFSSSIKQKKVTSHHFDNLYSKGLFFSGGCDSTASYIKYIEENPKLIMIWGADIHTNWVEFWNRVTDLYSWMDIRKIKSNTEEIYNKTKRNSLAIGVAEGYRPGYSYTINIIGVTAPLTIVEGINDLMLSSTYPSREYKDPFYPWTRNRPNHIIDKMMGWANVKPHDIMHEYTTNEKTKHFIRPYFEKVGSLFIRSCGHRLNLERINFSRLNCLECDKCERVIGMLALNGIDPNTCGYDLFNTTFDRIKRNIIKLRWNPTYLRYHWREIKNSIPNEIEHDFQGSRKFLEWLREYPI